MPIMSASRFTLLPGPLPQVRVRAGLGQYRDRKSALSDRDDRSGLCPRSRCCLLDGSNGAPPRGPESQISASPSGLTRVPQPTPSTCPCTICPPNLLPADIARSRLTGLPRRGSLASCAPALGHGEVGASAIDLASRPNTSRLHSTLSPARTPSYTRGGDAQAQHLALPDEEIDPLPQQAGEHVPPLRR